MPTYESLPAPSDFFKGSLYQQLIDDLRLAGKAKRTVYGYVRAVKKLAAFHGQAPDRISEQGYASFYCTRSWNGKLPREPRRCC